MRPLHHIALIVGMELFDLLMSLNDGNSSKRLGCPATPPPSPTVLVSRAPKPCLNPTHVLNMVILQG